jgi:glutamine amidotransferase
VILILNYGLGNISSVSRMIDAVGGVCEIGNSKNQIMQAEKIILPGVGSFDNGMRLLRSLVDIDVLLNKISKEGVPVLGICLGMQLLCRSSEEGSESGLGLIDAEVKKFRFTSDENLKVPNMGWNIVQPGERNPLIPHDTTEQRFYFVHSYRVVPDDQRIVIGKANYGYEFCAAFQKENIFGVQFHPEKSHRFGMSLLKRFVEL